MLTCPSVWGLWLLYACGGFAANFYVTLLPIYLQDHRHLSPEATSRIAGLSLGMGIVACAVGGLVSDRIIKAMGNARWGRRAVGAVGLALAGMGYVAVPHVEHAVLLGVVFAAVFFANDLSMGPAWAACADIGEKHAGTLSGSMNTAGNLAGAGGAALAGWLLHTGRSPLLFLIFGIVFGLGALSWLLVDGSKKLTRP
jgi:nitrate/nitrite transporter NarK